MIEICTCCHISEYKKCTCKISVPDYLKPEVKEAVKAEVDEICDNALPKDY